MKNNKKNFLSILLSIVLFLSVTINVDASINYLNSNTLYNDPLSNTTMIIRDNNSIIPLPNRFRNLTDLNISGSAEFAPFQLKNLIEALNNKDLYIVDLRQESHGYINTLPISFYNKKNLLNKDFTTTQTLEGEKKDLDSIKLGSDVNIYNKKGELLQTLKVNKVFSEETLVKENNINYKRFAVRDGGTPTLEVTDEFVEFIKNSPATAHLHFHCLEGEGRTTTFMSLYQMMNNKDKLPLDTILKHQLDAGGIILTDNKERSTFLQSFYKYTLENMDSNFNTPYSTWIKLN
ncbi:phosphatase [Clostridium gasigenes]|uniref:fused DSP-PTPase phosphatase/NAD kinase-like protein n=1 Tax=Clostridium gasigenes TaxID=94869 RepID=UPI00143833E7|nr:phosphatase [Clostridium gasigenes]NKF06357.1 phosphatase [Clostridium gasigenes]QSW20240.1 phosphatase [Clostridium gasigenes]